MRSGAVGDDLPLLDLLADFDDRLLVLTGPLVQADELSQQILPIVDLDALGIDVCDRARTIGLHDHAAIVRHISFEAGGNEGGLSDQERHRLPLHVRTHERAIGVVVLEERNQAGRNADHLLRRNIDVLDIVRLSVRKVAGVPGDDTVVRHLVPIGRSVGGSQVGLRFLVGAQPRDLIGQLAAMHLAIRRREEAVVIHLRENRQARNEADVRAFGGFDRADAAVVRDVHVAHFEAGSLAIEAAWSERRKPPLVRQLRERIRLVHNLRQFAAAEEILDRGRDGSSD